MVVSLLIAGASQATAPAAGAASCGVKVVATNFDAPGDDNYMPQLNQEWVRIKNTCAGRQSIGSWKIHDYNKIHTYRFPSTLSLAGGASITLRSGKGTNTATTRYWQRSYGAVWNNTPPERAYLRNASGTLISSRSEY